MVAKANGIDITAVGSGNPGASNVARALGMRKGAYVYGLDAVKGAVATGLGLAIFGNAAAFWCAAAAVIGHVYPITRRFAGGKGVATASGAMLVVHPFISLGLLFLWAVLSKTTKKHPFLRSSVPFSCLFVLQQRVHPAGKWGQLSA